MTTSKSCDDCITYALTCIGKLSDEQLYEFSDKDIATCVNLTIAKKFENTEDGKTALAILKENTTLMKMLKKKCEECRKKSCKENKDDDCKKYVIAVKMSNIEIDLLYTRLAKIEKGNMLWVKKQEQFDIKTKKEQEELTAAKNLYEKTGDSPEESSCTIL
jgi:hypothetical protein